MTDRRRTVDAPRVIVVDIGVDAALYSEPGNRVLVLRPGQTFNNAVAAAQRCLPGSHPDTIRTIVRTNLPGAPDFETPETVPARRSDAEGAAPASRLRWRKSLIPLLAAALAVVVVGAFGVVRAVTGPSDGPFDDEAFVEFARRGEFVCNRTGELQATCTDPGGGVLVSEATVGPRSVVYMFSYGRQRVGLRVFADAKSARNWAAQVPTQSMYRGVQTQGRFALWGTDPEKVEYYIGLLKTPEVSAEQPADPAGDPPEYNSLPGESGDPIVLAEPYPRPAPAAPASRFMRRVAPPEPRAPSSDGLPASLGAVMMATLGVGVAEADRAAEDGLERALPPVRVVAVRLTLGMPGTENSEPGDEGPSDDAPIDEPTEEPTDESRPDNEENAPDGDSTPTPSPQPTAAEPTPVPTRTSEPSEPSEPTPGTPLPSEPEPAGSPEPTDSPEQTGSAEPTEPTESPGSAEPTGSPESTDVPEPTDESPESTTPSDPSRPSTPSSSSAPSDSAPSDSAPSDSAPSDSAPSDSAPSDSAPSDGGPSDSATPDIRILPTESPLPAPAL